MHSRRVGIAASVLAFALFGCKQLPVPATPPAGMDERVVSAATTSGAQVEMMGEVAFGRTFDDDESVTTSVNLEMGRCYVFAAVGDPATVEEVKIYLFTPNGGRAFDKEGRAGAVASFCVQGQTVVNITPMGFGSTVATATPGIYEFEIKTTEGYGHVAFASFYQGGGAAPPAPAAPPTGAPAPPAPAPAAPAPAP